MRTAIGTIIPPRTFNAHSINSVLVKRDGYLLLNEIYLKQILYLNGVINSTPFDYCVRQISQVNIAPIIGKIPIPHKNQEEIAKMSARLMVGQADFAGLADAMHIPNRALSVSDRIDTAAGLDVLVAKSYGLDKNDYETILESFKAFNEKSSLRESPDIKWSNTYMKDFYGEMRKKALELF